MTDNIYVFETLRAAGTTDVFDNDGGTDWIYLNDYYSAVYNPGFPYRSGPQISLAVGIAACTARKKSSPGPVTQRPVRAVGASAGTAQ